MTESGSVPTFLVVHFYNKEGEEHQEKYYLISTGIRLLLVYAVFSVCHSAAWSFKDAEWQTLSGAAPVELPHSPLPPHQTLQTRHLQCI